MFNICTSISINNRHTVVAHMQYRHELTFNIRFHHRVRHSRRRILKQKMKTIGVLPFTPVLSRPPVRFELPHTTFRHPRRVPLTSVRPRLSMQDAFCNPSDASPGNIGCFIISTIRERSAYVDRYANITLSWKQCDRNTCCSYENKCSWWTTHVGVK